MWGSIPGLAQWVKDHSVAVSCGVVRRPNSDLACCGCGQRQQLRLDPLAWEPPYAAGAALQKKKNQTKKNDKKTPQCGLEDWFPPRRSAPTAQSPPTALWASPSFRAGSARPSTGVALAPQLRSLPPPAELTSFCRAHGIPFPESRALPGPRLGGSSLSLCLPESRTLTTPGSEKSLRRIVELRLAPCLQKKKSPSGSARYQAVLTCKGT